MTLSLTKLGSAAGVAADGIDLSADADNGTQTALRQALLDGLVLCIRGQRLDTTAYRDAIARFGAPIRQVAQKLTELPEIAIISSEDRDFQGDGKKLVAGADWHTDDSYRAVPCSLTTLYALAIPGSGGDTQFTNMYRAYEDLDASTRARIDGLKVVHAYYSSRTNQTMPTRTASESAATPDVVHPLVRTHPETGRKALYMNPTRMEEVVGLARAESDALLDRLITHAIQEKYQYRHRWRLGDILIWDNRCTMHKANPDYAQGERRLMHRIMVEGTVPV
jgi:taurine dioxygenase